ncbi:lipopolysaccharide biosynthesis protein [Myroides sp. DW712]|uniref:lipopolysaccharide biosynthesis protein n=1 Tax=Myroides sp. DW712 TaxID=3389800 RepID=UPI00397A7178
MDKKLLSSIFWAMTSQVGYVLIGLAGMIILGRLLSPEDFGVVGIGMFFVGIFNVLIESGMGGALVRKENIREEDYSTIFIFNLIVSIVLGVLLVLISPFIADFYDLEGLKLVLIVLSSILLINAFTITQNARLVREMKFKQRGLYKFISLLLAVLIAVYIAYIGGGYWAIIAMQVLSAFFLMVILWIKEGRLKTIVFSKESFLEMSSFGLFTTLASLLNAIFDNVYQLILGKYFSVSQVGFYYQAKKLQEAPDTVYKLVILQVFYSHLSKFQNTISLFKQHYNTIAKLCAIVLSLTTCLIYLYADEIIYTVLGEKWLGSVFYLRVLIISGFFTLQEMVNRNIFKIFDQTHKILYLELLKKSIQIITIILGVYYQDIKLLLYGFIFTSVVSYFINFYYSRKIVDEVSKYEIINFIKIVVASILALLFTFFLIEIFELKRYFTLAVLPVFLVVNFVLLYLFGVQKTLSLFNFKTLFK